MAYNNAKFVEVEKKGKIAIILILKDIAI